jgi:hypothetical protein
MDRQREATLFSPYECLDLHPTDFDATFLIDLVIQEELDGRAVSALSV